MYIYIHIYNYVYIVVVRLFIGSQKILYLPSTLPPEAHEETDLSPHSIIYRFTNRQSSRNKNQPHIKDLPARLP